MGITYIATYIVPSEPIHEPVTKMGGCPIGMPMDLWPVSPTSGKRLDFLGQFALNDLRPDANTKTAYLFSAPWVDVEEHPEAVPTYDPSSPEARVIVVDAPKTEIVQGPCPYPECAVGPLQLAVEPDTDPEEDDETHEEFWDALPGYDVKIGGWPAWVQSPERVLDSRGQPMRFFAQFEASLVTPGGLHWMSDHLGDGIGYIFISEDESEAAYTWQCT